jgi:protein disulfide-isomerase A6
LNTCQALYDAKSPVVKLTKDNFKKLVIDSDDLWFVEFFAPWCGHCKTLAPSWEKAAKSLKGVIKLGAVDMTTDQDAGAAYGIQGFPTIKFFGFDKSKPADFSGGRDADSIINYGLEKVSSEVKKRMKGGSTTSGSKEKAK